MDALREMAGGGLIGVVIVIVLLIVVGIVGGLINTLRARRKEDG